MKSANADVVIVGGGPAGCAAALTLRAKGCSVIVIDDLGVREKPTETSSPALKQVLASFGAESTLTACEPCYGIVSNWGRDVPILKPGMTNAFGDAWFIHRARFDLSLQQSTREKGVTWIKATAQKPQFFGDGVGISANGFYVTARKLVIATGSPSLAAFFTGQKLKTVDSLVAFWGRIHATSSERLLRIETAELGWWYSCPGETDQAVVCFITDTTEAKFAHIYDVARWNAYFQQTQIFRQNFKAQLPTSVNTISASTTLLPLRHGQNWVAIGDSAMKLDPLGSSGVILALESGRRAANAIVAAAKGGTGDLERYAQWGNQLSEAFFGQRRFQYEVAAKSQNSGFWKRRHHS